MKEILQEGNTMLMVSYLIGGIPSNFYILPGTFKYFPKFLQLTCIIMIIRTRGREREKLSHSMWKHLLKNIKDRDT